MSRAGELQRLGLFAEEGCQFLAMTTGRYAAKVGARNTVAETHYALPSLHPELLLQGCGARITETRAQPTITENGTTSKAILRCVWQPLK